MIFIVENIKQEAAALKQSNEESYQEINRLEETIAKLNSENESLKNSGAIVKKPAKKRVFPIILCVLFGLAAGALGYLNFTDADWFGTKKRQMEEFQNQLTSLKEENESLEDRIGVLNAEKKILRNENDSLRDDNEYLNKENRALRIVAGIDKR